MPPLQTCQLNIYWGESRASCGLKHLKQGKKFGLYNFLNRETSYINKMSIAIKAAHMLAVYWDDLFARGVVNEESDLAGHRGLNRMKEMIRMAAQAALDELSQ